VGIRIHLTVSAEEALAIGMDLAYLKAEKGRKTIQPVTCCFLARAFKETRSSGLNAYLQGKHMLHALNKSQFEP
jgi:hypothetical protein